MKAFVFSIVLLFAFFTTQFFSCHRPTDSTYPHIRINDCTNITVNGNNLRLCFDSLIQDSRCPMNTNCVWQGAATVQLSMIKGSQTHSFHLSTIDLAPQYNTDTIVAGYRVRLMNVTPYPGDGITAPYRVEVSVTQ